MIEERSPAAVTAAAVTPAERAAMERALQLAATDDFHRHGGNPRVGCVLLDDHGDVVGAGHHRGAGTPHAEVAALAEAGSRSRGATAVVTLEPCRHHGRTGPCTQALLTAGVRRVVYAQADPDPVAGGGAELLRAAGLSVVGGLAAARATALNADWTFAHQHGRPRIRLKLATTLDGRIAAADGSSRWITSAAARADGHRLRAASDAVVAGTGTILADDARLTARPGGVLTTDQPLRVVFGASQVPADAAVNDDSAETVQLATRSAAEAVHRLHRLGVRSVLIEGGPRTAAAFLAAGLVDEVISYLAPAVLGSGPAAVADLGITTIDQALRGTVTDVTSLGAGAERCVRISTRFDRGAGPSTDHPHEHQDHRHEGGSHVHRHR